MIERHDSLVVQKITRLLIPWIRLFALYVLAHGHSSPGGGFQAGVLIGASIILKLLVGSEQELKQFSVRWEFLLAAAGVGIYLLIGTLPLFFGGLFFDYGAISFLSPDPVTRRYWSILIAETGVTITVAMTLVVIFHVLAFLPGREES